MKKALFVGTFDPITIGHKNIIMKALPLFDKVVVAIGINTEKKTMFPLEKRLSWIKKTFDTQENIEVDSFSGLTVDYCRKNGIKYIIRGLRNGQDFAYENNIEKINRELAPEVTTIYLFSDKDDDFVSSTFVKEMIIHNRNVSKYLPKEINLE